MILEVILKIENLNITRKEGHAQYTVFSSFSLVLHRSEAFAVLRNPKNSNKILGLALINVLPENMQINNGNVSLYHQELPVYLIKKGRALKKQLKQDRCRIAFLSDIKNSFSPIHSVGSQLTQAIKKMSPQKTDDAKLQAIRLMQKMGIADAADIYKLTPQQAGQEVLYKIAIARIITQKPSVVIADDPAENLDITVKAAFYKMLRSTQQDIKFSLLHMTSHPQAALEASDRITVMEKDKTIKTFKRKELLENEHIKESFFSL